MTIIKANNTQKIKWYVMGKDGAIAGFTTKKAAERAMENYKEMGLE